MTDPLTIVRRAERPDEPWRNGAGRTRTLWTLPDSAARISVAELERDAPFSHLPGIDRTFCLLGPGRVVLEVDGIVRSLRPGEWTRFEGEAEVRARLAEGPVRAFNIMTARGRARHRVQASGGALDQAMLGVLEDGCAGDAALRCGDLVLPPVPQGITGRFLAIGIEPLTG